MDDNNINYEISFDFSESEDETNINDKINELENNNNNEDLIKETNEQVNTNYEELKQKKLYYKVLFADYKKFLKKINFHSSITESTCDMSTKSRSPDKSKIYNIKGTFSNLYKNIKKIKKDLFFINTHFKNDILVIDGENILKSNKYQQLIKLHLTKTTYDKYFNYWYYGGEDGLVQPMTSLNLSIGDKIYLIELLIKNYLINYNCIVFISGKSDNFNTEPISQIINNNSIIFPVYYNKEDLREQDDHLMLYVYYHLSKIKTCEIISGDKFKWFNHVDNFLKNFRLEYDFNNLTININSCDAYSNDIIIYKNYKYQLGYFYFPFITNLSGLMQIDINLNDRTYFNDYINNLLDYINVEKYELIINYVIKIFINLIMFNGENNIDIITNYSDFIVLLISNIIHVLKNSVDEIINIIDKLSQINKKAVNKIEKIDSKILYNIFLKLNDYDLSKKHTQLDLIYNDITQELDKFKKNIDIYIFLTNFYMIIKSMSFLLSSGKPIIKMAKLFSIIMKIYDKINDSIHKLRKISNESSELNKVFLLILSHHIFMKKNGFCKKDY